ncbi:MAG TPA: dTDP-4-dehydrorhamnose reductase [Steroidobacteraceae bacterium]|nr:dTDP-4-dehydrorhamnose reductase [Steroidobacteraceae bacterium]
MRVLVTGAGGQLGRALIAARPEDVVLRSETHDGLDIADAAAVDGVLREFAPELVMNAAAFTRVDEAERAPEAAARANSAGPAELAAACRRSGAWLTHVSTDYVFDGAQSRPYGTDTPPKPLNVYGRSKLAGETAVLRELPERATVVRASWLYSAGGGFAGRMLALMPTQAHLSIVSDQVGAPTSAAGLARILWALSRRRAGGLWHWCDSGVASWYDFAVAIAAEAAALGLLAAEPVIAPIASADYPTAAARPPYSLLDKRATERLLGITAPHWRSALRETLAQARRGARLPGCAP